MSQYETLYLLITNKYSHIIGLIIYVEVVDTIAAKHGGKAVILDNVDPSTVKLNFDTLEDFDKALASMKVVATCFFNKKRGTSFHVS